MSPAMVDFRSPATAASAASRSPRQNPSKGQISASSSSLPFDRVAIPASNPFSMDRPNRGHGIPSSGIAGDGGFGGGFASTAPFFPAASGAGKPSGLSKPRMTKVRKHLASPRVRPAAVPEAGAGAGSNPYQFGAADAPGRSDGGGIPVLHDKLRAWSPFNSEAEGMPSENPARLNSGGVKFGSPAFVFGSGSLSSPSVRNVRSGSAVGGESSFGGEGGRSSDAGFSNVGNFESANPEGAGFVLDAGSVSNTGMKDLGFGNAVDRTFSFGTVGSRSSDAGPFVFGSNVKKGSNSSRNSRESSSDPNLGSFESVKSEGAGFVFGASSSLNPTMESALPGSRPGCASTSSVSGESRNPSLGASVSESGLNNSSNPSWNSPEYSTGLNVGGFEPGSSEGSVFVTGADSVSTSDTRNVGLGNAQGDAFGFPNGENKSSFAGVFVFESGVKEIANFSLNLSENAGGHNPANLDPTKSSSSGFVFDTTSLSNFDTKSVGSGKTPSGASSFGSDRSPDFETDAFVSGSGVKNSSNFSQNSSLASDDGSFAKLPEEMRKLNLQGSSTEDGFQKTEQAGDKVKPNARNIFVFGSNKIAPSSVEGSAANKLPEEMNKLNIGDGPASQNSKNESTDHAAGVFVFGSNVDNSSVLGHTSTTPFSNFDKSSFSEHLDGRENPSTKVADRGFEVHESSAPNGFNVGNGYAASSSFEGSAVHTLHDDLKKLNIRSTAENSVGSPEENEDSATAAPTTYKYTFQAEKENTNSSTCDVPLSNAEDHLRPSGVATPFTSQSSIGHGFAFTFTSTHEGLETAHMEFRTPQQEPSALSKENLFTGPCQNMAFGMKKGEAKGTQKKRRGKSRQSTSIPQTFAKQFISRDKGPQENTERDSPDSYSPMDYSPCQETVDDQYSRETSIASDESTRIFSRCASTDTHKSISEDEKVNLVSATQRLDIKDDRDHGENEGSKIHIYKDAAANSSLPDKQISGSENVGLDSNTSTVAMEAETGFFGSNTRRQDSAGGTCFTFASSSEYFGGSNFAFAASPFSQGSVSTLKRHHRRKSRTRAGQDLLSSTQNANTSLASSPELFPVDSTSVQPDPAHDLQGMPFFPQKKGNDISGKKISEPKKKPIATDAPSVAAQEACEKWRLRGNQAYANGHMSKAEEYYTRGVNSISSDATSRSCNRALMLCYSNRAATRMSLGRMREALSDCMMAAKMDTSFLKAQIRAANCHLALGEIEDALMLFKKCLQSDNDARLDQKILIEASDGLRKAQQVADYMVQSKELLSRRTSNEVMKALQYISEALSISPQADDLMEMKAEALLMLRNYDEVIQLCEQTVDSAERNSILIGPDGQFKNADNAGDIKYSPARLWRSYLISRSYFYLGKLEEALELLKKHEQVEPTLDKYRRLRESLESFSVTVCELLRLKAAGNEAFQAGRHSEAVEHYTAALACSTESRPFAAICFCNRAAAYQALGQITEAIADCSLAIALDASYAKAISRRATLHEMIRDYGQAASDLCKLISLLEKQLKDKNNQSAALGRSTSNGSDLSRARVRLSNVEEESRKGIPLDMYMILGVGHSSTVADVRKAYRKAALRHHPDKAGQSLAKNENGDDGLWRKVADEVHADADRLFKMIGEAYAVLSDPTKRLQYDADEEIRNALKKGYSVSGTPKTPADSYSNHSERSSSRRQWRTYGSSYQRSSESSRSNR